MYEEAKERINEETTEIHSYWNYEHEKPINWSRAHIIFQKYNKYFKYLGVMINRIKRRINRKLRN